MRKLLALIGMLILAVTLSGCFDPEPGEISVIAKKNGKTQSCSVFVYNSKDVQINQVPTDLKGLVYIKDVVPGRYKLKFYDGVNDSMYPAVVEVDVDAGESEIVRVELTEGPAEE